MLINLLLILHANTAPTATPDDITLEGEKCAAEFHLVADKQPLSEVLVTLSDRIGFTLQFDPHSEATISIDRRASAMKLLRELLNNRNLLAMEEPDVQCVGRNTISIVKILPRGEDVPYVLHEPKKPGVIPKPALPNTSRLIIDVPPPKAAKRTMTEDEWQQMKRDYKAGKIAADPDTGKPISIEEYRRKTGNAQKPNGKSEQ